MYYTPIYIYIYIYLDSVCVCVCVRVMRTLAGAGMQAHYAYGQYPRNTWQRKGTGYAHMCTTSFLCRTFQDQQDCENSTAFQTHAASSCYMTDTNTLIVFLNKS